MPKSPPALTRATAGRVAGSLAFLLAFVLLAGCRPAERPAAAPPLRVAIDLWAGYYPLVIADARGFLRDEKVDVTLQIPGDTHRMIAEFAARRYDLIGVSLADVVLTTRVAPDIRLILNSDESAGADVIFGAEPLSSPTQLHGKRLGTTMGGFGELFVREFIRRQGVRPDMVTLVNADAAAVPELLKRGEIDIGHTWEPYAAAARAAGFKPWFSSEETPGLIVDGLVARGAVIRSRPAELRGLVRAWFRAVEWWRAHPAEGNSLIEARLHLPAGSVSLQGIRLLDRAENRRAFAAGAAPGTLRISCGRYVEFFITAGSLSQRVPADALLDGQFVDE